MNDKGFVERRKSQEEEFFAQRDAEAWDRLRTRAERSERQRELAAVSGIEDESILDSLVAHDITQETVAALSLVPIVEVAWADGSVDGAERRALLRAAEERGLHPGEPSYELFVQWLDDRPRAALLGLWKRYVDAVNARLDIEEQRALADEILGRARAVADAAGGFLGFGNRISAAEQRTLDELRRAFGDPV